MTTLRQVATWVRRVTWGLTATALVLAVALAMFDAGRHSAGDRELTVSPSSRPDLVAAAVADVEAQGLRCSQSPSLAASIVFERHDGTVELVTFDEALARAQARAGWVRWYCSPVPQDAGGLAGPA